MGDLKEPDIPVEWIQQKFIWSGKYRGTITETGAKKKVQPKPKPEPQKKSLLAEWVLTNLCSSRMLHISVVPAQDIDRLHGISNYETYMTDKVREQLGRDDVRVMVREADKDPTMHARAYNARLVFE